MIPTNCATCGKPVFLPENPDEEWRDSRTTKYWSFDENGEKRPYCDAACGLKDYKK